MGLTIGMVQYHQRSKVVFKYNIYMHKLQSVSIAIRKLSANIYNLLYYKGVIVHIKSSKLLKNVLKHIRPAIGKL